MNKGYDLMEKVHGFLVMTLLEMLKFLVLIIVHNLILIIEKKKLLALGEGATVLVLLIQFY